MSAFDPQKMVEEKIVEILTREAPRAIPINELAEKVIAEIGAFAELYIRLANLSLLASQVIDVTVNREVKLRPLN